jgi:hypothetical protein
MCSPSQNQENPQEPIESIGMSYLCPHHSRLRISIQWGNILFFIGIPLREQAPSGISGERSSWICLGCLENKPDFHSCGWTMLMISHWDESQGRSLGISVEIARFGDERVRPHPFIPKSGIPSRQFLKTLCLLWLVEVSFKTLEYRGSILTSIYPQFFKNAVYVVLYRANFDS